MTCFRLPTGENLNQFCNRTGIKYQSVFRRVEKGWDLEKAVSTPFLSQHGTKYFINGKPARHQMTKNEYRRYTAKMRKETK